MNTLHDYFEGQRQLSLSNQAKVNLYNNINRRMNHRYKNGFNRAVFFWTKTISMSLVVVLVLSSLRYAIPNGMFRSIMSKR